MECKFKVGDWVKHCGVHHSQRRGWVGKIIMLDNRPSVSCKAVVRYYWHKDHNGDDIEQLYGVKWMNKNFKLHPVSMAEQAMADKSDRAKLVRGFGLGLDKLLTVDSEDSKMDNDFEVRFVLRIQDKKLLITEEQAKILGTGDREDGAYEVVKILTDGEVCTTLHNLELSDPMGEPPATDSTTS